MPSGLPNCSRLAVPKPCRLSEARRAYAEAFLPELLPLLGVFIENHVGWEGGGRLKGGALLSNPMH